MSTKNINNMNRQITDKSLWQGRDDSAESPEAKRLFQVISMSESQCVPDSAQQGDTVLLGFACDEGVRRNQGRQGAKAAPTALRKALANLAIHGDKNWFDGGDIVCNDNNLEDAQQHFADVVTRYQKEGLLTCVLGGGHETAYAHGLGVFQAHPEKRIGIINFDAHLDMRNANRASSGTPFLQLANHCHNTHRAFNYLCIGASKAANTTALIANAKNHGAHIIWDDECCDTAHVIAQIRAFIESVDAVYLTIDLDVLSASQMFAVSAPAAFGIPLFEVMQWLNAVIASDKLIAGDVVEYNPELDRDQLCARIASRLIWQMGCANSY